MKKIVFAIVITLCFSCKKEWFDYRNRYAGKFEFTVHYAFYTMSDGVSVDTTYIYNGKVEKIKDKKMKIIFGARENDYREVLVDKEGHFSEGYMGGSFSDKNNVEFTMNTGGLGGGGSYHIIGKRID
ncbi:MAG: hypothetical protein WCK02_07740 [Bacteroidota bacterium]